MLALFIFSSELLPSHNEDTVLKSTKLPRNHCSCDIVLAVFYELSFRWQCRTIVYFLHRGGSCVNEIRFRPVYVSAVFGFS